jgi:hypothetical protein
MRKEDVLADGNRQGAGDDQLLTTRSPAENLRLRVRSYRLSDAACQLRRLAGETKRYSICERDTGIFEVCDDRRLLDRLLQWQAVLPFDELTGLSDFQTLRQQQSSGPTLNEADRDMLDWLTTNATLSEGEDDAAYFGALCQAAIAFKGDEEGVRRFLMSRWTARQLEKWQIDVR